MACKTGRKSGRDGRRGIRAEKEDAVWCRWKKHIAFCKPLCAPVSGFRQPGGIRVPWWGMKAVLGKCERRF